MEHADSADAQGKCRGRCTVYFKSSIWPTNAPFLPASMVFSFRCEDTSMPVLLYSSHLSVRQIIEGQNWVFIDVSPVTYCHIILFVNVQPRACIMSIFGIVSSMISGMKMENVAIERVYPVTIIVSDGCRYFLPTWVSLCYWNVQLPN